MSDPARQPEVAARRGRSLISWALFVTSAGLYFLTRQAAIVADGIYFDDMLQHGRLVNHHLLYLPLAWVVQSGLSPFVDVSFELAMKIVSAIAGGAGVALTFLLASRALQTLGRSLVAALTMMGLMGYWFHSTATELHALHAASAAVLMLGLLRALDCDDRMDPRTWCLCAMGSLLVPLSHMSGYAAALPALYAVRSVAASARAALLMALLCGGAGFAAIYLGVYFSDPTLGEAVEFATKVSTTGFSWLTAQGMLVQFSLYALPATTLAPAGLRVLFRTHSMVGWFCLLWVIAWPLASLRHVDDLYGSYHTATYPALAVLAVVALHSLAKSWVGAVLTLAVAVSPAWFLWQGDRVHGLIAWSLAAAALCAVAGQHVRRPRGLLLLAGATFAVSISLLWPAQRADLVRDRISAIARLAAAQDLVLAAPAAGYERFHWSRFFQGADRKERAVCPADVDWLARYKPALLPEGRGAMLAAYRSVLRARLSKQQPVWFVGEIDSLSGSTDLNKFADFLRGTCRFEEVEPAPMSIYRLSAKE